MIDSISRAWNRLAAMFRRSPIDRDLEAEIASHLEASIQENLRQGIAPEEARRRALVRFGSVTRAMEQHREERGLPVLDVLSQDLRFSLRTLRRDRAFAFIVILVLALGVGANVAVFSVINAILLRPLPFRDPSQLVWFATNGGKGGLSEQTYTVSAFEEFRRHNRSFQDVTSYQTFFSSIQYKLTGTGDPRPVVGVQVAENFFPMLGVEPSLGRLFTAAESRKGGAAAALLSHQFWQRQFGGDPSIIGRTITINATPADITGPVTVIGVLPASFDFGSIFSPGMRVDFYVPAYMDLWRTWGNTLAVIGRLKPGVSLAEAQAESNMLFPQLKAANRDWWADYKSTLSSLQDRVSGRLRHSLFVLWCAVGLILLIVCINVSNLLLARATSRSKEFAMRSALGAGRGRLARQCLTESLMLSICGSMLGVAFAWSIIFYLAGHSHLALPLLSSVKLDGDALAWTMLIAICAGAIFGVVPALKVSGGNLQESLKDGGVGMSQGKHHERLRSMLVISEVALACVLLVGSGLLLRSFLRLIDVDLGFQPARVGAINVEINDGGDDKRRGPIVQEMLRRVREIPGIEAAGISDMLPLDRNRSWGLVAKENLNDKSEPHGAFVYVVSPGYLETMGMRLVRGRDVLVRSSRHATCHCHQRSGCPPRMAGSGPDRPTRVRSWTWGSACGGSCGGRSRKCARGQGQRSDVHPDHPVQSRGRRTCCAYAAPNRQHRAGGDVHAAELEPGTTSNRIPHHTANRGSFRLATALSSDAGHVFCHFRPGLGFARNIRSDLVFSEPAIAGNRHTDGAGSEYGPGSTGCYVPDLAADIDRNWNRSNRFVCRR